MSMVRQAYIAFFLSAYIYVSMFYMCLHCSACCSCDSGKTITDRTRLALFFYRNIGTVVHYISDVCNRDDHWPGPVRGRDIRTQIYTQV